MNQDQILHVLHSFTGEDEFRPVFLAPFEYGDYVCASNAHVLIRVSKDLAPGDFSTKYSVPDVDKIIPTNSPLFSVSGLDLQAALVQAGIDYHLLTTDCPHCDGQGVVEWTFCDKDYDTHTKEDDCPCCDGSGMFPNGYDKRIALGDFSFNGNFILLLHNAMSVLDIPRAEVSVGEQTHRFRLSDKIDVVMMPLFDSKKRPHSTINTTPINIQKQ